MTHHLAPLSDAKVRREVFCYLGGCLDETVAALLADERSQHHAVYQAYLRRVEAPTKADAQAELLGNLLLELPPVPGAAAAEPAPAAIVPEVRSVADSVGVLIGQAGTGDVEATQRLWQRYYDGLTWELDRVAAARPRGEAGEQAARDAAAEILTQFMEDLRSGRYPSIHDRDDLWECLRDASQRRLHRRHNIEGVADHAEPPRYSLSEFAESLRDTLELVLGRIGRFPGYLDVVRDLFLPDHDTPDRTLAEEVRQAFSMQVEAVAGGA